MLTPQQIDRFVADGYVRIDGAFSAELAAECRQILWRDTGCDPEDASTWTRPVVRLGFYAQPPFAQAANTPVLHAAFDQLVGPGRWLPQNGLGTFPVRFPASADTGDTGWHVDVSFSGKHSDPDNFLTWCLNLRSRGRALLMLFLLSDVGEDDAPTRIRAGSHLEMARLLAPAGEDGLSLGAIDWNRTAHCPEVMATGPAGTVYLCHPFLVHAAQVNRGTAPRFLAQPPLLPREPFRIEGLDDDAAYVPVERAIRRGLGIGR